MAVAAVNGSVPAGDGGCCKRTGCCRPLPPGERGRTRQFCSDECRIRHYNTQRGQPAAAAPPPAGGPEAALGKLSQLLAEASRLAGTAAAQVAAAGPGQVAAVLAEAEAARRRAEAHAATVSAQAAESAESAAAAWDAADAAGAARAQAEARAATAGGQAGEHRQQADRLAGQLAAALARAEAAEREAAQAAAALKAAVRERDTAITAARRDAELAAAQMAAARQAGDEALAGTREQAARELTVLQASCQAHSGAAREAHRIRGRAGRARRGGPGRRACRTPRPHRQAHHGGRPCAARQDQDPRQHDHGAAMTSSDTASQIACLPCREAPALRESAERLAGRAQADG